MDKAKLSLAIGLGMFSMLSACNQTANKPGQSSDAVIAAPIVKHTVIFDSDANNELDDQHALAYLLLNGQDFRVRGITVNATASGGDIENHYREAERILKLCKAEKTIPLFRGANGNFAEIENSLDQPDFDGYEAVNFIIEEALNQQGEKLILIPVGKLTNIALALKKEPSIADRVRIVWLGSNYPKPGEYNQDGDIPSMNYVLSTMAPFEMVTVRYGDPSGTDAIKITQAEINQRMPGKGPTIETPITGRHGGNYTNFGDYAVSLFEHIEYHNPTKDRALFDLAAVAVIKNPNWATVRSHPCPVFTDGQWVEQPQNTRQILIWENFDRIAIIEDLFRTLNQYEFAAR